MGEAAIAWQSETPETVKIHLGAGGSRANAGLEDSLPGRWVEVQLRLL